MNEVSIVKKETQQEVSSVLDVIASIVVKNEDNAKQATTLVKKISEIKKRLKGEKDEYVRPAKDIIEKAKSVYDPIVARLDDAENIIRKKTQTYLVEQEEKRKKKEKVIAEKAEAGEIKESTAMRQLDKLGEEKKAVKTETGSLSIRRHKSMEITNPELVPEDFWIIDETRLKKTLLAMAGEDKTTWDKLIPGVKVVEIIGSQLN